MEFHVSEDTLRAAMDAKDLMKPYLGPDRVGNPVHVGDLVEWDGEDWKCLEGFLVSREGRLVSLITVGTANVTKKTDESTKRRERIEEARKSRELLRVATEINETVRRISELLKSDREDPEELDNI